MKILPLDRRLQLAPGTAIKVSCMAATTAPIMLSGVQTIDTVLLKIGDRCLVWQQADQTTNGVYVVDDGDWMRDLDFYGPLDAMSGTLVFVSGGVVRGNTLFQLTTANPVIIGISNLTFSTILGTGAGTGTVTSVSVVTANGISGTVANPTTTPAITLALGAITPTSIAALGTIVGSNLSGTNTGDQTLANTPGAIVTKTANYLLSAADYTVLCDATASGFTVTLPMVPAIGKIYNIKKIDASVNIVVVDGNGRNIDGASTALIKFQDYAIEIQYDGINWRII